MYEKKPFPPFITLDLDITSKEDLTPIAEHLEESTFIKSNQKIDTVYYLSLEPHYDKKTRRRHPHKNLWE
jgi:hypothetical protein